MSKETGGCTSPEVVYVVTCYQSIVGVYVSQEDACQVQRDLVMKNRPADLLCRPLIKPVNYA